MAGSPADVATAIFGSSPAQSVVEHDRHAIDDGQPRQGVLELVAHLRALQDTLRDDRPVVVVPVGLDRVDVELVVVRPGPVDDPVDKAAPQPGRHRLPVAELIPPAPGPDDRLLGAVLRLVGIADEARRQVDEPGQLGDEGCRERVAGTLHIVEPHRHAVPAPSMFSASPAWC